MNELLERAIDTFDPITIDSISGPLSLYGGFILGALLGIILQKGRLCKYDVISGMFRMQDFTFWRVGTPLLMLGMVMVYLFNDLGLIELYVPKTVLPAQIIGGIAFGAGLAIAGYCPAIAMGALGQGNMDAIPVILGMIGGSVIYAEFFYGTWRDDFINYIDFGRITFPDIFIFFSHWFFIIAFFIMCFMFLIGITMYDSFLKYSFKLLGVFLRKDKK